MQEHIAIGKWQSSAFVLTRNFVCIVCVFISMKFLQFSSDQPQNMVCKSIVYAGEFMKHFIKTLKLYTFISDNRLSTFKYIHINILINFFFFQTHFFHFSIEQILNFKIVFHFKILYFYEYDLICSEIERPKPKKMCSSSIINFTQNVR